MVTITRTVNIVILNTFFILLMENKFGNNEVIFQDHNAKRVKVFLQEKHYPNNQQTFEISIQLKIYGENNP